jgi:hypothetical protein
MSYFNGHIHLSDGRTVPAHLAEDCARAETCVCGFCKGQGQCEFGDCRNPLPAQSAGTLCLPCSSITWRAALPGHRASTAA